MLIRFILVNFLVAAIIVGATASGMFGWAADLPRTTWLMVALLGGVWCAGMCFVIARNWAAVYHTSNLLPILGLVLTGLGIQIARHAAPSATADAHLFLFNAIIESMSTTFISVALMAHVRECAYWIGGEHV